VRGSTSKGDGREERGDGKGIRSVLVCKVKASRINIDYNQ